MADYMKEFQKIMGNSSRKRTYSLSRPHPNAEIKRLLKQVKREVYKKNPNGKELQRTIRKILALKGKQK